eukprot:CAMPEP_0179267370 /NCGR_PEP_ID=MMETSP0797-20121207/29891_1 /TAXON_ID=47934 /ORGANISM="Dinophysis acuminata, Strain DAEP01" /LENGTH=590 /DNA_ID=CAMNT_0020975621 /DNA_START=162 /DNA_END=1931 /DNA_ORIENTATION=-
MTATAEAPEPSVSGAVVGIITQQVRSLRHLKHMIMLSGTGDPPKLGQDDDNEGRHDSNQAASKHTLANPPANRGHATRLRQWPVRRHTEGSRCSRDGRQADRYFHCAPSATIEGHNFRDTHCNAPTRFFATKGIDDFVCVAVPGHHDQCLNHKGRLRGVFGRSTGGKRDVTAGALAQSVSDRAGGHCGGSREIHGDRLAEQGPLVHVELRRLDASNVRFKGGKLLGATDEPAARSGSVVLHLDRRALPQVGPAGPGPREGRRVEALRALAGEARGRADGGGPFGARDQAACAMPAPLAPQVPEAPAAGVAVRADAAGASSGADTHAALLGVGRAGQALHAAAAVGPCGVVPDEVSAGRAPGAVAEAGGRAPGRGAGAGHEPAGALDLDGHRGGGVAARVPGAAAGRGRRRLRPAGGDLRTGEARGARILRRALPLEALRLVRPDETAHVLEVALAPGFRHLLTERCRVKCICAPLHARNYHERRVSRTRNPPAPADEMAARPGSAAAGAGAAGLPHEVAPERRVAAAGARGVARYCTMRARRPCAVPDVAAGFLAPKKSATVAETTTARPAVLPLAPEGQAGASAAGARG